MRFDTEDSVRSTNMIFFVFFGRLQLAVTCAWSPAIVTSANPPLSAGSSARMCSEAITCGNCTTDAKSSICYWDLQKQSCQLRDGNGDTGNLTVSIATDCPRTRADFDGRVYRLSIVNDKAGLIPYLGRVGVNCSRGYLTALPTRAAVVHVHGNDSGEIVCYGFPLLPGSPVRPASAAGSFYVTFGPDRVMLRTDDRADFYASALYVRECNLNGHEYCVGYLKKDSEKR